MVATNNVNKFGINEQEFETRILDIVKKWGYNDRNYDEDDDNQTTDIEFEFGKDEDGDLILGFIYVTFNANSICYEGNYWVPDYYEPTFSIEVDDIELVNNQDEDMLGGIGVRSMINRINEELEREFR